MTWLVVPTSRAWGRHALRWFCGCWGGQLANNAQPPRDSQSEALPNRDFFFVELQLHQGSPRCSSGKSPRKRGSASSWRRKAIWGHSSPGFPSTGGLWSYPGASLAGIEDVVVNAVGLSFILQIDELLCIEQPGCIPEVSVGHHS